MVKSRLYGLERKLRGIVKQADQEEITRGYLQEEFLWEAVRVSMEFIGVKAEEVGISKALIYYVKKHVKNIGMDRVSNHVLNSLAYRLKGLEQDELRLTYCSRLEKLYYERILEQEAQTKGG